LLLKFDDTYKTEYDNLNIQNKILFEHFNNLVHAVTANKHEQEIYDLFLIFTEYYSFHIKHEKFILKEVEDSKHHRDHFLLLNIIKRFSHQLGTADPPSLLPLLKFLNNKIKMHIVTFDKNL